MIYNPFAMSDGLQARLDRVLAQLRLYEHPLLNFSAQGKGDGVEVIIRLRTGVSRFTPITLICTRATSTIRSSNGAFSDSSMTRSTTILSRCLSVRRRTAPTARKRDCE